MSERWGLINRVEESSHKSQIWLTRSRIELKRAKHEWMKFLETDHEQIKHNNAGMLTWWLHFIKKQRGNTVKYDWRERSESTSAYNKQSMKTWKEITSADWCLTKLTFNTTKHKHKHVHYQILNQPTKQTTNTTKQPKLQRLPTSNNK